jgi:hypothetical protein
VASIWIVRISRLDQRCRRREDLGPGAGDDGAVAFFEVGDPVGHGGQRDGVGADIHLAVAMPDGQGRALAGGDQQVVLAREQEHQRKGSGQFVDGPVGRLARG